MIAIVLLNYGQWKATVRCLDALSLQTDPNFEVWIVDNASPDDSAQQLQVLYADKPSCHVIVTSENLGFAGGCNVAIRSALLDPECEAIWLLNNDTLPNPDALAALCRARIAYPQVGIFGSTLLHYGTQKIQAYGGRIRPYFGWVENVLDVSKVASVDYAVGASCLVTREVFDRIGLLPEHYFLYFEETDFAMRARRAGFSMRTVVDSLVEHEVSLSMPSRVKLYYTGRNQLEFFWRWFPLALPLAFFHLLYARVLPRIGKPRELEAVVSGIVDFIGRKSGRTQRSL